MSKLMPPGGQPKTEHFKIHPALPLQAVFGSQLKPHETDDPAEEAALRAAGWTDWKAHESAKLSDVAPERETVRLQAPSEGPASVMVSRDGNDVLYPARGRVVVDARDADALRAKGFVDFSEGPSLPNPREATPGQRHHDTVSGATYALASSGEWHQEGTANDS